MKIATKGTTEKFGKLACLLYHTRSTEHVARTDTLHLDTYSMNTGKHVFSE